MSRRRKKKQRDPPPPFTEYLRQPGQDSGVDRIANIVAMVIESLWFAVVTVASTVKSVLSSTRKRRG